jgi:hypothetical protein
VDDRPRAQSLLRKSAPHQLRRWFDEQDVIAELFWLPHMPTTRPLTLSLVEVLGAECAAVNDRIHGASVHPSLDHADRTADAG